MSFTCPRCGAVSHNPRDEAEGYCGACRDWTAEPPRERWRRLIAEALVRWPRQPGQRL